MNRQTLILLGLLAIISLSCSSKKENAAIIKTVKIDTVKSYGAYSTAEFPGKVRAASDVNLAFRVSGTLLNIPVHEGQTVKSGQVIAIIDPRDYKTQLDATTAEYSKIKGEAERIIALYKENSVSKNDYEKAVYGLQQITAKLEAATNAYNDTKLTAPFNGSIQKVLFEKNETVAAGMPIISMITNSLPEVEINIPITEYIRKEMATSYSCTFDIAPNREFPLELIGINQKANLNQLYKVRLKMSESNPNLTPGMSTTVKIQYKTENNQRMQIPISAIYNENNKAYIWRYNPQSETVSKVEIELESLHQGGFAVITKGPNIGDIIVTAGANSMKNGINVKPIPSISSSNVGGML